VLFNQVSITQYAGLLDFDGGKDAPGGGELNSTHVANTLNFFLKLKKTLKSFKKWRFFIQAVNIRVASVRFEINVVGNAITERRLMGMKKCR
jgi:hypothetical protein